MSGNYGGPLREHGWEVGLAYGHLGADQWFVGTSVLESAAPFGKPLFLNINSIDANISTDSRTESA